MTISGIPPVLLELTRPPAATLRHRRRADAPNSRSQHNSLAAARAFRLYRSIVSRSSALMTTAIAAGSSDGSVTPSPYSRTSRAISGNSVTQRQARP